MDKDTRNPSTVTLPSPRSAMELARVYRRQRRRREGSRCQRWLRIVGLVGTMFFHLFILFFVVLGPAYQPPVDDGGDDDGSSLQVRFIEPKKEPPVVPTKPVIASKKGSGSVAQRATAKPAASPSGSGVAAVPVPEPPAIAPDKAAAPVSQVAATPPPPITAPQPAPAPQIAPVPVASEPPPVKLDAPTAAQPVPPKFQPEPVRKPQLEGNESMPPPASLAQPVEPPTAAPVVTASDIAMQKPVPTPHPSVGPVVHVDLPAAPQEPQMQAIPLPAQQAPAIQFTAPSTASATPATPREQVRIQAPSISVAEPEVESVPISAPAAPQVERPTATMKVDVPKIAASGVRPVLDRPQLSSEPATDTAAATDKGAADKATGTIAAGPANAAGSNPSSADTTPGSPHGASATGSLAGKSGLDLNLPAPAQGGSGNGSSADGAPGSYVQLRPHGDTEIMHHGTPNIGYKATRFEKDWTPEGESSIDTALRHAVEKTTVRHTFQLPGGVRINCVVMPLLPMALFGCGGDPPPKRIDDPALDRQSLAPANPLAPPPPGSTAPPPPAPVKLDNTALCAAARVAGGPTPPGCEAAPVNKPTAAPTNGSWVQPSDQFH